MFEETPLPSRTVELFRRLTEPSPKPVYVLGRNKYAERIARVFPVTAFIDDFTKDKTYLDKPVIRMREVPPGSTVVSCVVDTVPVTGMDNLRAAGLSDIIDYFSLSRLAPERFGTFEYATGNREDITANRAQYEWLYNRLADEMSKQQLKKIIQFRLNLDLENMRGFELAMHRQYIENFLPHAPNEVFVDGGGFDGQNTKQFVAWNPAYRRVYYFEPGPAMMEKSRTALASVRDVRFIQKGLYCRTERVSFNDEAGGGSAISSSGKIEIEVARLDDEVSEPATFIKMDIEGVELDAIDGAANQIRAHAPKLAICVYHKQPHFWQIPRRILELHDGYRIFLRHYTQSFRETVMFFVPSR